MGTIYNYSVASVSWINARTELREVDEAAYLYGTVVKAALTSNNGYRFCNFMNVYVELDTTGRIMGSGFLPDSGIYRAPSFARLHSHAFDIQRSSTGDLNAVTFRQTAGARTVSPEVIGEVGGGLVGGAAGGAAGGFLIGGPVGAAVGGLIGGAVGFFAGRTTAHQLTGFPPIWSILEIKLTNTGQAEDKVVQHSIFPSLTYYVQADPTAVIGRNYAMSYSYDARKEKELPSWKEKGWGPIQGSSLTSGGNPWGITKGVMGIGEDDPN
jgi:hypothetical protein